MLRDLQQLPQAIRAYLQSLEPLHELDQIQHGFAAEMQLMQTSQVDYTMFFRALCELPQDTELLEGTFHAAATDDIRQDWQSWLERWNAKIRDTRDLDAVAASMRRANPRYTWREWLVAPAYEMAERGDYTRLRELQSLFSDPYVEQSSELAQKSDQRRPTQFERLGGVSHYSCSS